MVDFKGYAGQLGLDFGSINLVSIGTWLLTMIILAVGLGFLAYWVFIYKKFNKRIIIWERIGEGNWFPTKKDRAKTVKIGTGGQELLYLMKNKVYRPAYGQKTGINTFHFAIAPDGYWHSIVIKNLQGKQGGTLETVDPAMQYQYVAIEQTLGDRYNKTGFWEKHGLLVVGIGLIFIIGIIAWLWFKEWSGYIGTAVEVMKGNERILTKLEGVLGALDNVCSGSGIKQV